MSLPIKFHPILLVFIFGTVAIALASMALAYQATLIPASRLMNPDDLVKILQSAKSEKPLIIQVGSHVLYTHATATYMRSCSSANPRIKKPTRATGVAMRHTFGAPESGIG
jgi:hypothetical protein